MSELSAKLRVNGMRMDGQVGEMLTEAADALLEHERLLRLMWRGHIGFNRLLSDEEARECYAALQKAGEGL